MPTTHTRTRTRTSICVSQINEHRPLSFSTIEWTTQHFMIVYEREADKEEGEEGERGKYHKSGVRNRILNMALYGRSCRS